MTRQRVVVFWILFAGLFGSACLADNPATTIRSKDLKRHVSFLASDELAGRETGRSTVSRTEDYIASALRSYGLRPLPGRDSLFVDFTLYTRDYDREATQLLIRFAKQALDGEPGVDFRPFEFSDDGSAEAELVFAGYGITAPELGYDDYDGLDVEGKIVLVLRHEPGEADPDSSFDGTSHTRHAQFAVKADLARDNGAAGMILVTDPLHHAAGDDLRLGRRLQLQPFDETPDRGREEGSSGEPPFLAVHASREVAGRLVESAGLELEQLQRALEDGRRPAEFDLRGARATLAVRRIEEPVEVPARNVVGFLEGRDPDLKHQWIVVGGHHDHVGGFAGEGDTVFNGADDNASGTAGVLELAQAFAQASEPPRRSMVFATFTAEEKGLLGSRALVEQELLPVDRVVFMLNLDMIGRNPERELQVFGDGYVKGLRELVERSNADPGLRLDFAGTDYAGNSDHHPFYQQDVPFLFLFTGIHEDYHRPGDHADKLDYGRMERIVRLGYNVLTQLADDERNPDFVHHIAWLGMRVETVDGPEGRVARVEQVDAGSRAELSGLRRGDVLEAFDGRSLESPGVIGRRFREIEPGTKFGLVVRRGDERVELELARAKTGFMGIGLGAVDDDTRESNGLLADEGVRVRNVLSDGPSETAGLKPGDIILRLAGLPVSPSSLRGQLSQIGAGETVAVLVLRDGERRELTLTLGERPSSR